MVVHKCISSYMCACLCTLYFGKEKQETGLNGCSARGLQSKVGRRLMFHSVSFYAVRYFYHVHELLFQLKTS